MELEGNREGYGQIRIESMIQYQQTPYYLDQKKYHLSYNLLAKIRVLA